MSQMAPARPISVTLAKQMKGLVAYRAGLNVGYIALQFAVIAAAIYTSEVAHSLFVTMMMLPIIATRQFALMAAMHEAAHYNICRNRNLNDAVGALLLSHPFGFGFAPYRAFHFQHHKHLNTQDDPEHLIFRSMPSMRWPKTRGDLYRLLVKDLFGLTFKERLPFVSVLSPWAALKKGTLPRSEALFLILGQALLLAVLFGTGSFLKFLLYWLLPLSTFVTVLMRIKAISEHGVVADVSEVNATRTITPRGIEALVFYPMNTNYHLEHHLFPYLPHFNLAAAHNILLGEPSFAAHAEICHGIFGQHGLIESIVVDGAGLPAHA